LPPCSYYLITFTLPAELRCLARSHPKIVYGAMMKAAADSLQKLARDPRFLGARIGALAVLHTWTRAMLYHPHVHMLVTAGGLSADGLCWVEPKNPRFLVPVRTLSVIFRAKMGAALKKAGLLGGVVSDVWNKPWVVHCQHAGSGERVLHYLGRYVFRIALTNNRLERIQDGRVTFCYRDNRTQKVQHCTISGIDFLQRFLQHVLPRGCTKVRYYGIFSPHCHSQLEQARQLLFGRAELPAHDSRDAVSPTTTPPMCPYCRIGKLIIVETLQRIRSP